MPVGFTWISLSGYTPLSTGACSTGAVGDCINVTGSELASEGPGCAPNISDDEATIGAKEGAVSSEAGAASGTR